MTPGPLRAALARAALAVLLLGPGVLVADAVQAQQLQPIPPLKARVTDLTGTLDASQVQSLEAMLADLEASASRTRGNSAGARRARSRRPATGTRRRWTTACCC